MARDLIVFFLFLIIIEKFSAIPLGKTTIQTRNAPSSGIELKILRKPHHLFIGRCKPQDPVIHQENVILFNDGKSQVSATIRMNVEAMVYITCVKIFDEVPDGEGGYPKHVSGGVDHNYVEFNVTQEYGKGFHFFVQIFGNEKGLVSSDS